MKWEEVVSEFNKNIIVVSGIFLTISVNFTTEIIETLPSAAIPLVFSWFFCAETLVFVFYSFGSFTKYLMHKNNEEDDEKRDEAFRNGDNSLKYCNYAFFSLLLSLAFFILVGLWLIASSIFK